MHVNSRSCFKMQTLDRVTFATEYNFTIQNVFTGTGHFNNSNIIDTLGTASVV
jgi:hypothetical protein